MLRSLNTLIGSSIHARDGEMGTVSDYLFDDETWTVRYMVVETGSWLASRKVLISPTAVDQADWAKRSISVLLTKEQVQNSPHVDADLPVSRQQEVAMTQYYGWPAYGSFNFVMLPSPPPEPQQPEEADGDPHLRSAQEVAGYGVAATDEELGHVDDFIIQDADWFIQFLAVAAGSRFGGHKLLVPTRWIESVSWPDRQIVLSLPSDKL
jgi:uncharacterized protein YrrD